MANEQASTLSFSIQEAVWLNRGQEIDSVLSLSLDPDITIQESEEYVTVKGNLVLSGEYSPGQDVDEQQQQRNASLSEQVSFRSIEEVRISDEGLGMIRHPFPIDVTIPRSRIYDVDQIYVNVNSFDYDLPGNGCIELQADVSISGMQGEFPDSASTYTEEETSQEEEQEPREFHYEAVRPAGEQEDYMRNEEAEDSSEEETSSEPVVYLNRMESEDNEEEAQYEEDYAFSANDTRYTSYEAEEEVEEQAEQEESEEKTYGTREEENALYLTKVLARDDEEAFSRLRMCIVQSGESLETISARYNIPVSQLMRQNRLNEERVEEGQILYIPSRISSPTSS
ncbi:stage VI sporulation protein D [Bacillus sp. H-16]|uniref:stage VI sporulation protein D n=1 Tax=Alteribacter salitolerans TaxID=2912333 RepID=UPI001962A2A8|nr:stage VI sporulation protein D [Alteribacter salitolerans]